MANNIKFVQNRAGLPASLAEECRFFEKTGEGKLDNPKGWNTPENWKSLDEIPEERPFGFCITNTDYLFIDFDHVFNEDGKMIPDALNAYKRIASLSRTYTEKSISGRGLHMICDLGDYEGDFKPTTNDLSHIITFIPIEEYKALGADEKKNTPKIELFYHTSRMIILTGDNTEVIEPARDENAAAIFRECLKMVEECHHSTASNRNDGEIAPRFPVDDITKGMILDALNYCECDNYSDWIQGGMAIYNIGLSFDVFDKWSQKSDKYNDGAKGQSTAEKWESFKNSESHWNAGTIFKRAKANGWHDPRSNMNGENADFTIKSAKDIQESQLSPIQYAIEDIIPEGYTVLSAQFKIGKSWLVLWMCIRIAQGLSVWGKTTNRGATLYCDLEGCEKFTQERINILLKGEPAPDNFYVAYRVPTLDDDLIGWLDGVYRDHPDLRLVAIDVLAMVQYQTKRGESAYQNDYRTGTALKHWADDKGISIIAVTHTTKSIHPDDVFMNTTGTNGVTGSADAIIMIAKEKRQDKNALMAIVGRRVREQYYNIHLDDGCIWQMDGVADNSTDLSEEMLQEREYKTSEIREGVIAIAKHKSQKKLKAREIIQEALDLGIYITKGAKDVGLFIHKNQVLFMKVDNVRIKIIQNGSGSKIYELEYVDLIEPNPFIVNA